MTTKPRPRALGSVQRSVLRTMQTKKTWYSGCGWIWSTLSETMRVLDSLAARGYVTKEVQPGAYVGSPDHVIYTYVDPSARDEARKERLINRLAATISRYDDGTARIVYVPDDLLVILADGVIDFFESGAGQE